MVGFNYFAMELLKIIVGCGLLVLVGYFLEKNNRIIAIILGLLSLLYFTEVSFAMTCSELTKFCEAKKAYYDERIALQTKNGWPVETNYVQCDLQTPPTPPGSKSRYIEYSNEYGGKNYLGSCALDPEKCAIPKVKVGMEANGVDEKCACPSGTSSMDISYFNSDYSGSTDYLKKTHGKVGVCGSPPEGSKTPGRTDEQCCVSNLGCADGYKPDPTGAFIPTSPMATACVLDVPSCPEGTTSQSITGGRATAETQNRNVAGCEGDNCCIMEDSPCAEGYLPNPDKQPTDPEYCYKDGNCPEGTQSYSGFMGNSNLSYLGNFPSPAYPEYQGFCNTTGCCMGCRSGFEKSNDFCVNKTGEEPPKLCAQGTVMGAYISTTNSSFGSDAYHTAMDCACPLNSVTRSPNAEKGVMLSGGMHIGGDPNATYQDAVCDYSKVPSNDMSQVPNLEDYFDGSKGACAMLPNGGIDKEKCFKMDGAMKDWLADNVDCGSKQGLECISPKMQEMMSKCKVVAGVVTCSNFQVGDNVPAGSGQVQLPDWVVDSTDKFGFPLPSFEGFEDDGTGTGSGSTHKTSSSSTSTTSTTTSTSSTDAKKPVKMFDDKPTTGSGSSTGGLDYFKDAWNSSKNQELRGKIDEVMVAFQRQRMFEIKMSGGEPPCADFSKVELPYNWKLENICLLEPPYVYYFDVLRDVNLLLSMLLPAIIMLRQ